MIAFIMSEATSQEVKRTFVPMTCGRAKLKFGNAPRDYGYTLAVIPPQELVITGEDIEGIGWVQYRQPKKVTIRWQGWYKYRSLADQRAFELNK